MIKPLFLILTLSFYLQANMLIINFDKLNLSELITITSKVIGKNILVTEPINGKIGFVGVKRVNKDELFVILEKSLFSRGFSIEESNGFYTITKYKEEEKVDVVEVVNLDAKALINVLKKVLEDKSASKFSLLEDYNAILVVGKEKENKFIKELIYKLDKERAQVFVKARIVELNSSKVNKIGIEYGLLHASSSNGEIVTFSSNLNSLKQQALSFPLSDLGLSLGSVQSAIALGATLNFLKQEKALDIISEPSILCLNNFSSSIYVGEKRSIKVASTTSDSGSTKESFNREDIGLILKVKPRISKDAKVQLDLHTILENFSQTNSTNEQPDTFKKEIKTRVILNNGESVILGGLIEKKKESMENKVPFFSSIPIVGELFKNTQDVSLKKNLVLIVTPYIVPKAKDLTFLRKNLSQLKQLEDNYLQERLNILKKQSTKTKKELSYEEEHKKRLKEYFGI